MLQLGYNAGAIELNCYRLIQSVIYAAFVKPSDWLLASAGPVKRSTCGSSSTPLPHHGCLRSEALCGSLVGLLKLALALSGLVCRRPIDFHPLVRCSARWMR